jgi:hypothetical protein
MFFVQLNVDMFNKSLVLAMPKICYQSVTNKLYQTGDWLLIANLIYLSEEIQKFKLCIVWLVLQEYNANF